MHYKINNDTLNNYANASIILDIISEYNNNNSNIDFFANSDKKRYINGFQHFIAGNNIVFISENNNDKRDKSDKIAFNPFNNFITFTIRKIIEYDYFFFYRNAGFCIYCLNTAIKRYYCKNTKKKGN